jgi:hypothetical protein
MKNFDTINCTYEKIAKELKENRNQSKCTIDTIAEWLKVDKRKIIDLENLKRFDLKLMCEYADIYGIDLKLTYKNN